MENLALSPEKLYTYADYRQWDLNAGERYEIIDGVAYAMSAPNGKHQAISMELSRQLANFLKDKPCKVFAAPYDVRLFYEEDESDDTVVQPDLTVICDEAKRGLEGCRGIPDMVIEILSPSNTEAEMFRKLNLYTRAGVKEYWVVDGNTQTAAVYIREAENYRHYRYTAPASAPVAVLPGLTITLADVFAE
jgi:Uma2 family endonuclease